MHTGEVGIEIAPVLDADDADAELCSRFDAALRRTCSLARVLTGAEQAALKLWVDGDPGKARKYFSLSDKYAEYRDFRVDPQGFGLHGMAIPAGEVVRLTQEEVVRHPLWQDFRPVADAHPPMRGWLATSVCGEDGRSYGLLRRAARRSSVRLRSPRRRDATHSGTQASTLTSPRTPKQAR